MKAVSVEVRRGGVVESIHRVHAVAVENGRRVAAAGDPELVTFFRSASKPIQALPVVLSRSDLTEEEVALVCASHMARPDQLSAVRSLLAKAPAHEDELECGPEPTKIEHDCSGKHAGMLALCRARGWPSAGYRLEGHPCQQTMLEAVASAAEVRPADIRIAVDGCGVLTFALTLERMAHAFSRLEELEGGDRIARAMRGFPHLVRGPHAVDTQLMEALPGWIAKVGAEGLLCATSPGGLGVALKVEDGGNRAVGSALGVFLASLGFDPGQLGVVEVRNSRDEVVGELRS